MAVTGRLKLVVLLLFASFYRRRMEPPSMGMFTAEEVLESKI